MPVQIISIKHTHPITAPDIIDVADFSTSVAINEVALLANDVSYIELPISIHHFSNAIGGTISKVNNTASFVPSDNFKGLRSFEYHAKSVRYLNEEGTIVYLRTPEMPKDPMFFQQYYLFEINQVGLQYTGKKVSVLVTDNGMVPKHRDLAPVDTSEFYFNSGSSTHALMVAGVIGAKANSLDVVGIAPDSHLYSMQLSFYDPRETNLTLWKDYDIINNSWGYDSPYPIQDLGDQSELQLALKQITASLQLAAENGRSGLGSIIVWAAGNSKSIDTSFSPLNNRHSIIVSGIHPIGLRESMHLDRGELWNSSTGAGVLISAPDDNIAVLDSEDVHFDPKDGLVGLDTTRYVGGTSFSAPIVSGVIALVLEAKPDLGYRDVQEIIALSALQPDKYNYVWERNNAPYVNLGGLAFNQEKGFGLINARAAVRLAETWIGQQTAENELALSFLPLKKFNLIQTGQQLILSLPHVHTESVVEFAQVKAIINTDQINNFSVSLTSPSNTTSVLFNSQNDKLRHDNWHSTVYRDLFSTHFRGEKSQGQWNVTITHYPGTQSFSSFSGNQDAAAYLTSIEFTLFTRETQQVHYLTDDILRPSSEQSLSLTLDIKMTHLNTAALSYPIKLTATPTEQDYKLTIENKSISLQTPLKQNFAIIGTDYADNLTVKPFITVWPGRGNDVINFANINPLTVTKSGIFYHVPWKQIGQDIINDFDPQLHTLTSAFPLANGDFTVSSTCKPGSSTKSNLCSTLIDGDGWSISFNKLYLDAKSFLDLLNPPTIEQPTPEIAL